MEKPPKAYKIVLIDRRFKSFLRSSISPSNDIVLFSRPMISVDFPYAPPCCSVRFYFLTIFAVWRRFVGSSSFSWLSGEAGIKLEQDGRRHQVMVLLMVMIMVVGDGDGDGDGRHQEHHHHHHHHDRRHQEHRHHLLPGVPHPSRLPWQDLHLGCRGRATYPWQWQPGIFSNLTPFSELLVIEAPIKPWFTFATRLRIFCFQCFDLKT